MSTRDDDPPEGSPSAPTTDDSQPVAPATADDRQPIAPSTPADTGAGIAVPYPAAGMGRPFASAGERRPANMGDSDSASADAEPILPAAIASPGFAGARSTPEGSAQSIDSALPAGVLRAPALPGLAIDDDALREAVGAAKPKRSRSGGEKDPKLPTPEEVAGEGGPRSRRTLLVVVLSLAVGVGVAALVLLGRVNQERYFLTCSTSQAVAQQGRSFPPWGAKPLTGVEWRPIALPANAQCKSEELDGRDKLEAAFLELLLERTSASLTAGTFTASIPADAKPGTTTLDAVAAQLEQALLLSRSPDRSDQRKQVERMLGDVQYWRASLRLRDATGALSDAARQFDAAALQRPLHVSDAGEWATFLRRLSEELQAGPSGAPVMQPASEGSGATAAPLGSALPVETEPSADSAVPPPTPDAGIPSGGVLL